MSNRIRLKFVTSVSAALLVAALVGASSAGAATLVCNGSSKLCDKRLNQVVLPGSHNAMSNSEMNWSAPNQRLSMIHQLGIGIRSMLIDTHWGIPSSYMWGSKKVLNVKTVSASHPDRKAYLCHSTCELGATSLSVGFHWIASFLSKNPNEVLVVVVEDYVGAEAINTAATEGGLSGYVYKGATSPWPTLRSMITSGKRLVMLTESSTSAVSWYHPAYQGLLRETPYSFSTRGLLTTASQLATSCRANRGGNVGGMFLMNHFVTPAGLGIPTIADSTAVNAKSVIVARARACKTARGMLPTILAVNHVNLGDVVGAARTLNGL